LLEARNACKAPADYDGKFTVRQIRVDTPLQFLGSVSAQVDRLKAALPLKEKSVTSPGLFTKAAFDGGVAVLRQQFGELKAWPDARIAGRLIPPPALENCDETDQTVDVVYRVYSFRIPANIGHVVEGLGSQVSRSVLPTPTTAALNQWKPRPFFGYDRTRGVYGGTEATLRGLSGPIQEVNLLASGSSSFHLLKLGMAGSKDIADGPIAAMDWRGSFHNSEIPSLGTQLGENLFSIQLSAVSRTHGENGFLWRFGGEAEAGRQRSEISPSLLSPDARSQSAARALKLYAGVSAQPGSFSTKASYGIQIGNASSAVHIDYLKHIWDAELGARLPALHHRQLTFNIAFGAGVLKQVGSGRVPVTERFFGGNSVRSFMDGDSWTIHAGPLVRGFPANDFAKINPTGYLGSDRYISLSSTLAYMVWSKPLTPSQLTDDPEFPRVLDLALSASRSALYDSHLAETEDFLTVARSVKTLEEPLTQGLAALARIAENSSLDEDLMSAVENARDITIKRLTKFAGMPAGDLDVRGLVTDIPADPNDPGDVPVDSLLKSLTMIWRNVEKGLETVPSLATERENLRAARTKVEDVTSVAQRNFQALEHSAAARQADELANREIRYSRRILNQLFHEVNLVGVSPVVFADTGQIWQSGAGSGLRYSLGWGIKLTLVSLELTGGYSWNIRRKPWEQSGAWVFSFDLANILR
jgi:hypothetical protein